MLDHEICWLWTKHKDLKNVVVCYWHLIFISHNVKILYENKGKKNNNFKTK